MDKEGITVYHGSEYEIRIPEYGKGNSRNDYGRGFYCTEDLELAKEWACSKGTDGYANRYALSMDGLRILRLNAPGYSILNWLAVLAKYRSYWQNSSIAEEAKEYLQRHFLIDFQGYDIVIGYRANDSYFSFAQDFVANAISLRKLTEAMHLGRLGEQVVLKSRRSFDQIRFLGSEPAPMDTYFEKKSARDRSARRAYRDSRHQRDTAQDIFMLDIMREGMENGDPRLR